MTRPRLRIVTGKGGVGKTTVATALALAEAGRGQRTLLAEINGRDRVASVLGIPPVGASICQAGERLSVVDMNPRAAIHEYALMVFRFEAIVHAVFDNRVVRRFLALIPSLGELVMLGKVWFHIQEVQDDRPRFDVVVLDAPSTGHAMSMLRAPAMVQHAIPPGPLRDITRDIIALISDPERTHLHVVTTPEEMPVTEAVELECAAAEVLQMKLGFSVINCRLGPLSAAALEKLEASSDPEVRQVVATLRQRETRRLQGEEQLRRLPAHMLEAAVGLPRLLDALPGRAGVKRLAELLLPALEREEQP
ncbi:MAG: ArsA family ATPase [Deltaproteobacteria bacterium]|nr:ArsA family ATPase [Deltaproteobacteria bacterium]